MFSLRSVVHKHLYFIIMLCLEDEVVFGIDNIKDIDGNIHLDLIDFQITALIEFSEYLISNTIL